MATCKELTDEYLICSICKDVYNKPITLPCGHSMCTTCLESYAEMNPDTTRKKALPCPYCRQWHDVTSGNTRLSVKHWVAQFKTNIALQDMVDAFHREEKHCTTCKDKEAEAYCTTCKEVLCRRCKESHNQQAREHHLVYLSRQTHLNERDGICKEHPNQNLELYCGNCDRPICPMCGATTHKKCSNVHLLSSHVKLLKRRLIRDQEKIDSASTVVNNQTCVKEKELETFLKSAQQSKLDIQKRATQLRSVISEKEKNLLKQLEDLKSEHELKLRKQIEIERTATRYTCQTVETLTDFEIYERFQSASESNRTIQQELMSISKNKMLIPKLTLKLDLRLETIQKLNLGVVNVSSAASPALSPAKPTLKTARLAKCVGLSIYDGGVSDLVVTTVNGHDVVVVTDPCDEHIKSCYLHHENRTVYETNFVGWTVNEISPGQIVTADWKTQVICIFDVKPELSISQSIKTEKMYRCVTALSSDIIVAGSLNPPSVDILDISGFILKSFNEDILKPVINPFHICIDRDFNILVMDRSMICLSMEGTVVFTYCLDGEASGDLNTSRGIAVDETGAIFAIDYNKLCVIQLTKEGHKVGEVVGKDTPQMTRDPWSICFDSKGNMLVIAHDVLQFEFQ